MKNLTELIIIGILSATLIALIVRAFFKGSAILTLVRDIGNDTLKKNGKWSKTAIIATSAWFVVLWSFHYDLINNGFNETAWMFLGGVALGAPITKAWSKKVDPTVAAPKENKDEPAE